MIKMAENLIYCSNCGYVDTIHVQPNCRAYCKFCSTSAIFHLSKLWVNKESFETSEMNIELLRRFQLDHNIPSSKMEWNRVKQLVSYELWDLIDSFQ